MGKRASFRSVAERLAALGISVSYTTIRKYEQGREPEAAVLMGLAVVYNADPMDLFSYLLPRGIGPMVPHATTTALPPTAEYGRRGIRLDTAAAVEFVQLPVLAGRIAAGEPLVISGEPDSFLAFRADFARRFTAPVLLRVGRREESMWPDILPDDLIAMDQADSKRTRLDPKLMYVLNLDGGGTIKHVELVDKQLVISARNPDRGRYPTRLVRVDGDQSLLDIVKGEVVWIGRYLGSGKERR